MSYYRLYSFDLDDSHIIDVSSFEADSDSAAFLQVLPGEPGVARELWNLGRKVLDFAPRTPLVEDGETANRFSAVDRARALERAGVSELALEPSDIYSQALHEFDDAR